MVQWLLVCTALPKAPHSAPRTHVRKLKTDVIPLPGELALTHVHTDVHVYIIKKEKKNKSKTTAKLGSDLKKHQISGFRVSLHVQV